MRFLQIGGGPAQFAILRSGWLNGQENGYYHLIYESPEDGDLTYEHHMLRKDELIKKFPFTKKWFSQRALNIIDSLDGALAESEELDLDDYDKIKEIKENIKSYRTNTNGS